jgi:AraC-like DNA-binding protein
MKLVSKNVATFREQICRHLFKLDFKPHESSDFSAAIEPFLDAPEGMCIRLGLSPGAIYRDRELARDGVDSLTLIIFERGSGHVEHMGQEADIPQGGVTLLRNCEPGRLSSLRARSVIGVVLPPDTLLKSGAIPDRLLAQRWADTPTLKLLRSYLTCIARIEPSPDVAAAAGRHICELTRLAALESEGQPEKQDLWQIRLAVALQTINQRYDDPYLNERSVAAEQGVSTRYLQKIFERAGLKFTDRLHEVRLAAVHRNLLDERSSDKTILRMAMDAGYRDISSFNRFFLRVYGDTPSQIRKRGPLNH